MRTSVNKRVLPEPGRPVIRAAAGRSSVMAFAHAASNSASSTCRPTKFAPITDAIRLPPPERLTDAIPPLASAASHAIEVARSVRDDLAVCGDIQGGGGYPCARARNAQRQALFRGPAGSPSTFAPMSADRCRSVCWRSFFRPSSHSLFTVDLRLIAPPRQLAAARATKRRLDRIDCEGD